MLTKNNADVNLSREFRQVHQRDEITSVGSLVDDAKRFLSAERTPYGSGSLRQGNKTSAKAELSRRAGRMESWLSGLKRRFAKPLSERIVSSNLTLSAR